MSRRRRKRDLGWTPTKRDRAAWRKTLVKVRRALAWHPCFHRPGCLCERCIAERVRRRKETT